MILPRALYDAILAHGEKTWPQECCGFLVGAAGGAIDEVVAITNAAEKMKAERPDEFTRTAEMGYVMDPMEQLRAEASARERGRVVRGVYHSHVEVGAYFSAEDKRRARFAGELMFPDPIYIVADVKAREAKGAKAFVWSAAARDFVEEPIEIV